MYLPFGNTKEQRYSQLDSEGEDAGESNPWRIRPSQPVWTVALLVLLTAFISAVLGFFVGRCSPQQQEQEQYQTSNSDWLPPDGSISLVMQYNRTFSNPPSNLTTAAWASIFPDGVGFVQHPIHAPAPSGIAVFHQLHCLDALRIAYYTALAADPEHPVQHVDHSAHDDPHHVRHCFDYLRQSFMCHADTNLEPIDEKLGGTTGWGSEKMCRDYGRVSRWAARWAATKEGV